MEFWLERFHLFLLILLRVSALLVVSPLFGHRNYLARAKIGLAFMVALVVFPLVETEAETVPTGLIPYVLMMMREVVMGLVLGYAVLLVFIGIQFAGQLAGLQMGFGIVNVIDPSSGSSISIIGQFLNILAILIVLTINGHHLILRGLAHSFEVVPLGGVVFNEGVIHKLVALSSAIFIIAIKISAPVLLALFLISVALGILARTVPQMNVFVVGFPVQLGVGMAVMMVSLPLFYGLLNGMIQELGRDILALLEFLN